MGGGYSVVIPRKQTCSPCLAYHDFAKAVKSIHDVFLVCFCVSHRKLLLRILLASRLLGNSLPQGHDLYCPCGKVDECADMGFLQTRSVHKNLSSAEIFRRRVDRFPKSAVSPARWQGFSAHSVYFAWMVERKNVRYKESCRCSSTEFLQRMCRHHKLHQSDTQGF